MEVDEGELREGESATFPGEPSSARQAPETGGEVPIGEDRAVEATNDSVLHDLLGTPGEVSVEGLVGAPWILQWFQVWGGHVGGPS